MGVGIGKENVVAATDKAVTCFVSVAQTSDADQDARGASIYST